GSAGSGGTFFLHRAPSVRVVSHRRAGIIGRSRRTVFQRGYGVVALPQELQDAHAMAERIAQVGDAAPRVGLRRAFQYGASGHGLARGRIHVLDHEVQVYGRPVARIVAAAGHRAGRSRALLFAQQVNGRACAQQLDAVAAEAAGDFQAECVAVELDRAVQVVDIDVD